MVILPRFILLFVLLLQTAVSISPPKSWFAAARQTIKVDEPDSSSKADAKPPLFGGRFSTARTDEKQVEQQEQQQDHVKRLFSWKKQEEVKPSTNRRGRRGWFKRSPYSEEEESVSEVVPKGGLFQRRQQQQQQPLLLEDSSRLVKHNDDDDDDKKSGFFSRVLGKSSKEPIEAQVATPKRRRTFFGRRRPRDNEDKPVEADSSENKGVVETQKESKEEEEDISATPPVAETTDSAKDEGVEEVESDEPVDILKPAPKPGRLRRRQPKKQEEPSYTIERVPKERGWFGRKKKAKKKTNEADNKAQAELEDAVQALLNATNITVTATTSTHSNMSSANETDGAEVSEESNTTQPETPAAAVSNATMPPLPPPQAVLGSPSGMIITGYPQQPGMYRGAPYQYYRRGGPMPPSAQPSPSGSSLLLAELLASVLGTLSRLWFLTWLTKRIASQEESHQPTQHYVWERLNDRHQRDRSALHTALQAPPIGISSALWWRQHVRKTRARVRPPKKDLAQVFTRTVVVIELSDNPKQGINLEQMADVVTFLLQQHSEGAFGTHKQSKEPMELEVVFLVQSPGGSVSTFGLAAAQMQRLSQVPGISTTVCVDKYAASGGYMIASQAHKLLAAPFATLGSIGVIMEGLNFNELAQRYGVQPVVLKAGASKNPVSTFGPISNQDLRHEEERLAKVHDAFQQLVIEGRPAMADSMALVGDGSVFLGQEALDLQMVDEVMTSDEYLLERILARDRVLRLHQSYQARMPRKVSLSPLDLLPHLQGWLQNMDKSRAKVLLAQILRAGGFLGVAQQVLQIFLGSKK